MLKLGVKRARDPPPLKRCPPPIPLESPVGSGIMSEKSQLQYWSGCKFPVSWQCQLTGNLQPDQYCSWL